MAFLFKSKKNHDREKDRVLSSRDGPPPLSGSGSQSSSIISTSASRLARDEKNSLQRSTPTGSLNSLENDQTASPDQANTYARRPGTAGDIGEKSDLQLRNGPGPALANNPNMSLYPWSQRRLTYSASSTSPFPRYGAAVNATSSKEGDIYVMGGLINSQTVKGDLWMIEAGGNMSCYQLATTSEGPSPRVGHSSLLVGNAFIVYGGDTKIDESDILDETLYLLNTSTKQWSRALPAGPRPSGRYGHSLNILGSKIFIFGGQVEGFFMNDLAAFDLNQLQMPNNRWEIIAPNSDAPNSRVPPARTNHSMVSYNDKMYLFGGTNGFQWFNDVWCFDPAANSWSQLDCIGYIPVEREGHAAALVDDVMYIFGGRTEDGADLDDLAAFRITSRRWYTFQNMGPSPSPRSGHSMTAVGKSVIVLGGEPSSPTVSVNDLALVYVLDTTKIRYPDSQASGQKPPQGVRRPSQTDGSRALQSRDGSLDPGDRKRTIAPGHVTSPTNGFRSPNGSDANSPSSLNGVSKIPRTAVSPAGPPPQGQPPRPSLANNVAAAAARARNTSSERGGYAVSPVSNSSQNASPITQEPAKEYGNAAVNGGRAADLQRPPQQPMQQQQQQQLQQQQREQHAAPRGAAPTGPVGAPPAASVGPSAAAAAAAAGTAAGTAAVAGVSGPPSAPRSKPTRQRGPGSMDSTGERSLNNRPSSPPPPTRQGSGNPLTRRLSARNSQTVALLKELDSARNRNAWYASELELARKAGYSPSTTPSPLLDGRATEAFDDDDKPLIEALLAMRQELANVQSSVDKQAILAAKQIAEAEKQRDAAIQEAVYAKAKLAAHGGTGSASSTPRLDGESEDRVEGLSRKLAAALSTQKQLQAQLERASAEAEAEKRARQLADDTMNAAQKRLTDLESYKQQTSYEIEGLKSELHNAQREAREQSVLAAEATAAMQLLRLDKGDLERQVTEATGSAKEHDDSFESLRAAIVSSSEIRTLLEGKLEEERAQREAALSKLASVKAELEARTVEVTTLTQRLQDAEELAEKHANEAHIHRQAVLASLDKVAARSMSPPSSADAERVATLQAQLEAANGLVKKHQKDADAAAHRLRSAEERIAGLEAYQEQSSREGVSIRRQLQAALRETQTLQAQNTEFRNTLASQQLETNAMAVQHSALKDLLSERGISPTAVAAAASSSSSGSNGTRAAAAAATPEHEERIRGLEQQLATTRAAHEETKQALSVQASEAEAVYRDKLTQLENDYQSAVHYVKGTEKMLKQMKEQLARYKAENGRLKAEVEALESSGGGARDAAGAEGGAAGAPADWEAERDLLTHKVEALQSDVAAARAQLEQQVQAVRQELRQELEAVQHERDAAQRANEEATGRLATAQRSYEALRQESVQLERRAQDAEQRVGLLLDQVGSSVGNYRRRSRQVPEGAAAAAAGSGAAAVAAATAAAAANGQQQHGLSQQQQQPPQGHSRQDSSEADSVYGESTAGDVRNSAALDSLANELETLRTHWEATNKNYRLSNAFDFEAAAGHGGGGGGGGGGGIGSGIGSNHAAVGGVAAAAGKDEGGLGLSESLADWRKRLDD